MKTTTIEIGSVVVNPGDTHQEVQRKHKEAENALKSGVSVSAVITDETKIYMTVDGKQTTFSTPTTENISIGIGNISFAKNKTAQSNNRVNLAIIPWEARLGYPVPNISSDGDINLTERINVRNASKLRIKTATGLLLTLDNNGKKTLNCENGVFSGLDNGVKLNLNGMRVEACDGVIDIKLLVETQTWLTAENLKDFTHDKIERSAHSEQIYVSSSVSDPSTSVRATLPSFNVPADISKLALLSSGDNAASSSATTTSSASVSMPVDLFPTMQEYESKDARIAAFNKKFAGKYVLQKDPESFCGFFELRSCNDDKVIAILDATLEQTYYSQREHGDMKKMSSEVAVEICKLSVKAMGVGL